MCKHDINNRRIFVGDFVKVIQSEGQTFLAVVKWFTGQLVTVVDYQETKHDVQPKDIEVIPEQA